MILAVMSYPRHFHITQMSVRHALKHIPGITEVIIIWDDTHKQKPSRFLSDYLEDIGMPATMIPWSAIVPGVKGWLGQQIIKLHLDQGLMGADEFIILDGDLIINQDIDPANITYANALPREHSMYNHIYEILGIGAYDFGSCPFMYVKAQWLQAIRELCKLHSHADLYERFMIAFRAPESQVRWLNEWELIATYITRVAKIPRKIEYFHRFAVKTRNFELVYNDNANFVLDGPDFLSMEFYAKNGVTVDEKLWNQLYSENGTSQ